MCSIRNARIRAMGNPSASTCRKLSALDAGVGPVPRPGDFISQAHNTFILLVRVSHIVARFDGVSLSLSLSLSLGETRRGYGNLDSSLASLNTVISSTTFRSLVVSTRSSQPLAALRLRSVCREITRLIARPPRETTMSTTRTVNRRVDRMSRGSSRC